MKATIKTPFTSPSSAQPTITHPKESIMKKHTGKIRRFTTILLLAASALIASGTAADAGCVIKFYRRADFIITTDSGKKGDNYTGGALLSRSSDGMHDANRDLINRPTVKWEFDDETQFGDQISSVEFTGSTCGNTVVELYEHIDFGGRVLRFTQSISNLKDHNFNDEASSLKVYFGGPTSPNWDHLSSIMGVRDVAAGPNGIVKIVSSDGYIFTSTDLGASWQENHNLGSAAHIAVDPQGMAWVVTTDGTIYLQTGPGSWEQRHNALARDISVGADGTVMIVSSDGYVFKFVGTGVPWEESHNLGSAARIAVAPDGRAWVVTTDGTIYRETGRSSWELVHLTAARDISVGVDGVVWIAAPTGGVTKLTDPASSLLTEAGVIGGMAMNISTYNHAFVARYNDGAILKEETYVTSSPLLPLPYPVADPIEFDGNTSATVAFGTLPASFTVSAEVRVDASSQWQHVIELGGLEHSWNAPFKLEVGNEGQWYVSVGDGASYAEAEIPGAWTFGTWTEITVTYDGSVCKLYENGRLLHTFTADKDVMLAGGSLILGSFQGTDRYFQGGLRNVSITEGETPPPPPPPAPYAFTDPVEFDGSTSSTVAFGTLPASFTASAEVRVDVSSQWQHVLELGGLEHSWNAPFRLQVGNEGQWYVAVGNGTSFSEVDIPGVWTFGTWTQITVTYDGDVCKLYENGQLLHTFTADKDVTLAEGSLILGSYQGNQRYFQGGLRNVSITAGETPPVQ